MVADTTNAGEVGAADPDLLSVLVVDDHRSFADLLAWALNEVPGMTCVGTAATAREGVRMAGRLQPDVVVMDIEMPTEDGIVATRQIRQVAPKSVIAVVTAHNTGEWVFRAAQAGASAFISKDGSMKDMIGTLRQARQGQMLVANSAFAPAVPNAAGPATGGAPAMRPRELEVLQFLGQGLPAKEIASILGISMHTCRGYVKSLLGKLQVSTQLEAVIKAQQLGLLPSG